MEKPVLVVMAAGMGSRYGGRKQIDPVGPGGQLIIDYSLYDARRAGFETVVFVIKQEMKDDFRAAIGDRLGRVMNVEYAYQRLDALPAGFTVPEGRVRPWGTCHAVLAAKDLIDGPFAVINADDYYGPEAFRTIYGYLSAHSGGDSCDYCMVGYLLKNTLSDHGSVSRGICTAGAEGRLANVTERTRIGKFPDGIRCTEDGGRTWTALPGDALVSMNLWGFGRSFLREAQECFAAWLTEEMPKDPLRSEYFLPFAVSRLIDGHRAGVYILTSHDKWYGVTYRDDKPAVAAAIAEKTDSGLYPADLWGEPT